MSDANLRTELQNQVKGEVLLAGDAGYEQATRIFNAMIERQPAVIVRCAGKQDAWAALRVARAKGLPIAIRGGGHSVSGNALCDGGMVIDLSPWKEIHVDTKKRTARAAPGLNLGEFDRATTAHGLVTTMGTVSQTGISGLTLGGGLGWLMGRHGLACDNLAAAEVLTADGYFARAGENENPDLLWGLRGGGGNFGIVTEFEYRLHDLPQMIGGFLVYPLERARESMRFFREITADLPDSLIVAAALLNMPDGTPVFAMVPVYSGDLAEGEKLLKPIRSFGPPLADLLAPMEYTSLQTMLDAGYPSGRRHYWKSGFTSSISDEVMERSIEHFARRPSPYSAIFFEHMHGAAARVPETATAFPHRLHPYNVSVFCVWEQKEESEANIAWIKSCWEQIQPQLSGGTYVNYMGAEEGAERVRNAYGANYERLVALKNKYDPENVFHFNQNIRPRGKAAGKG